MVKVISTIKATLTRIIFSVHSFIAVWQVNRNKKDPIYWTLCGPIGLLMLEGVFTLAIKKNQEWRWFCPSVFLYLGSVVPAIWLLELEKVQRRLDAGNKVANLTSLEPDLKDINKLLGGNIKIPDIKVDAQTWTTLIEQFLMLILIVGRWMLPKGDLTRDQLSQLLLVYIGTAADIIEFFDSYKDDSIAKEPLLVYLTLGIWSWSLLQFTIVLSATRSRKPRGGGSSSKEEGTDCCNDCCCGIDVWGIALNVVLQDAPFLTFRLLIIVHYRIINYMNVFFTCKNSLVILLQLYRLYVVNSEFWKLRRESKKKRYRNQPKVRRDREEFEDGKPEIFIISEKPTKPKNKRIRVDSDDETCKKTKYKKEKSKRHLRKDTGYSTASSQNIAIPKKRDEKGKNRKNDKKRRRKPSTSDSESGRETKIQHRHRHDDKKKYRKGKHFDPVLEESIDSSDLSIRYEVINEKRCKKKRRRRSSSSSASSTSSSSSSSS